MDSLPFDMVINIPMKTNAVLPLPRLSIFCVTLTPSLKQVSLTLQNMLAVQKEYLMQNAMLVYRNEISYLTLQSVHTSKQPLAMLLCYISLIYRLYLTSIILVLATNSLLWLPITVVSLDLIPLPFQGEF